MNEYQINLPDLEKLVEFAQVFVLVTAIALVVLWVLVVNFLLMFYIGKRIEIHLEKIRSISKNN